MRPALDHSPLFRILLVTIAAVLLLPEAALAQETPPMDNTRAITYTVARTDRLRIAVFQEPDLSVISRVDAKGSVNLPLVGEVVVAGLNLAQAQARIENAYRDGRFLRAPQVTLNVEEYAPREISISGEVRNPGRLSLPVEAGMTVLEAITRAGGFTDTARGNAINITRILPDGTKEVYTVDVQSTIRGRARANVSDSTLILLPGDIVYVPQRIF